MCTLRNLLVIAILLFGFDMPAQNQKAIDSLTNLLTSKNNLMQIESMRLIANEYAYYNNEIAFGYIQKAHNLALAFGDSLSIVRTGRTKGQLLRRLSRMAESVAILGQMLKIAERNEFVDEVESILNSLGVAHTFLANYDLALKYSFRALDVWQRQGDIQGTSTGMFNIGMVYYKIKNYTTALSYLNQALEIKTRTNNSYDLDRLKINIGLCHCYLGNSSEAIASIKDGFSICGSGCTDDIKIEGEFGFGVSYFVVHNYDEAEKHFNISYQLSLHNGDQRFQPENLYYLGMIESARGNYLAAERYFLKTEQGAIHGHYNLLLMGSYQGLAGIYKRLNLLEKALVAQEKYMLVRDSILNEEISNRIMAQQAEYDQKQNLVIISGKEAALKTQQTQTVLISIIAVLLMLLSISLIRMLKNKQQANRILDSKVKERTKDLQTSRDELQLAYLDQTNFLARTTSEVRAPIATLRGIYSMVSHQPGNGDLQQYFDRSHQLTLQLGDLMDRIGEINRLNARKPEPKSVCLATLLLDFYQDFGLKHNPELARSVNTNLFVFTDPKIAGLMLDVIRREFLVIRELNSINLITRSAEGRIYLLFNADGNGIEHTEFYLAKMIAKHLQTEVLVRKKHSVLEVEVYFKIYS